MPYRRATLLVPSGPAHDSERKHLFIVLTDPAQVTVKHSLLVGVTTLNYAEARIEASQKLINGVKQGVLVAKEILAEEIFARVCKGLADSRFTAPRIKSFYEAAESVRKKQD